MNLLNKSYFLICVVVVFSACRKQVPTAKDPIGLHIMEDRLAFVDYSGQEIVFWKSKRKITATYITHNKLRKTIELADGAVRLDRVKCTVSITTSEGGELSLPARDVSDLDLFENALKEAK